MKELFKQNKLSERQQTESIVKKKKEIEYHFDNTIKRFRGHNVYEINIKTLEVNEAEFIKKKDISWRDAIKFMNGGYKKEILIKSNCVYISALNKKNAIDRFKKNKGSATLPKGELKLKLF